MTIIRSLKIIIIKAQFNHTERYLNMGIAYHESSIQYPIHKEDYTKE